MIPIKILTILCVIGIGIYTVEAEITINEVNVNSQERTTATLPTVSTATSTIREHTSEFITNHVVSIDRSTKVREFTSEYGTKLNNLLSSNTHVTTISKMNEVYDLVSIEINTHPSTYTVYSTLHTPTPKPIIVETNTHPSTYTVYSTLHTPTPKPIIVETNTHPSTYTVAGSVPIMLEQNNIPNNIIAIVYDHTLNHNELVVTDHNTALAKIIVTEETNEPRLNFRNLLETDRTTKNMTVTYPNDLAMDVVFDGIDAELMISEQTMIIGPKEWDGVMNLPVFEDVSIINDTTLNQNITSVLAVGLDDETLNFNKPVNIIFSNKSGEQVGFQRGDKLNIIDVTCNADDPEMVATQLGGKNECKIDSGADLIVWTYHFTEFFTMSDILINTQDPNTDNPVLPPDNLDIAPPDVIPRQTPNPNVPESSIISTPRSSGGGGGGGGGGGSRSLISDPVDGLSAAFNFEINNNMLNKGLIDAKPGDVLAIVPILPNDHDSNVLQLDVKFTDGTQSTLIHYNRVEPTFDDSCIPVMYGQIGVCDDLNILSESGPSHITRSNGITNVFGKMYIPLQNEFVGTIQITLVDTQGITLAFKDSYQINISDLKVVPESVTPEPTSPKPAAVAPKPPPQPVKQAEPVSKPPVQPSKPACGPNTIEIDGICEPKPTITTKCGAGTIEIDGICTIPQKPGFIEWLTDMIRSILP